MFCGKCGRQNDDNAKFCIGCGQPLNAAAPAQGTAPVNAGAPAQAAAPVNAAAPAQAEENLADDGELVAVIAAAIAAAEGTTTDGFVVRSIRKVKRNRR